MTFQYCPVGFYAVILLNMTLTQPLNPKPLCMDIPGRIPSTTEDEIQ